jgi:hypothetical protein
MSDRGLAHARISIERRRKDAVRNVLSRMGIALLVLAAAACGRHTQLTPWVVPAEVPESYQALYHELDVQMHRQLPLLPAVDWGAKPGGTAFGVDLLTANSSRGDALLDTSELPATILTLDRLKALGARCVTLSIQYPVLASEHPKTAELRSFYRQVAAEARRRGFVLVAEMGTASREPELSRIAANYRGLTRRKLAAGLREMAEAVIADIRPDYLTVLSEPETQARNTGLPLAVRDFADLVRQVVKDLAHDGVKLGAGAGSWETVEYLKALAAIPELDYLDLHIYPIQHGFAYERVLKAAELARERQKAITIGAAWLYKISSREFGRIDPLAAFARDNFSFWQTLDEHFIEMTANLAREIGAEFCSFFRTNHLYGYVEYTAETGALPAGELMRRGQAAAAEGLRDGTLTRTGEFFKRNIGGGR